MQNMRNGGETVINWNLALDQNGGPHQGHCGTRCNGVVEIAGARSPGTPSTTSWATSPSSSSRRDPHRLHQPGRRAGCRTSPSRTRTAPARVRREHGLRVPEVLADRRGPSLHTLPGRAVATFTWDGTVSTRLRARPRRLVPGSSTTAAPAWTPPTGAPPTAPRSSSGPAAPAGQPGLAVPAHRRRLLPGA